MGKKRLGQADRTSAADAMALKVIGGATADDVSWADELNDWREIVKGFGKL